MHCRICIVKAAVVYFFSAVDKIETNLIVANMATVFDPTIYHWGNL